MVCLVGADAQSKVPKNWTCAFLDLKADNGKKGRFFFVATSTALLGYNDDKVPLLRLTHRRRRPPSRSSTTAACCNLFGGEVGDA